jgi:hypothetical protein
VRLHELYASQANRNARFKELKARGYNVRKSVVKNQLLDPHYVADSGESDKGLANAYRTYWGTLYCIDEAY